MSNALKIAAGMIGGGGGGDPYFANVVSLLNFDGDLTDVTGKIWTASGNAAATGTAKFGSNSLICNGVGDGVYTADSNDWDVGAGDYTVEFWAQINSAGQLYNSVLLGQHTVATNPYSWAFMVVAAGTFNVRLYASQSGFSWDSIVNAVVGTATPGAWHFMSISRQGPNIYAHFDGVLGSTSNVGATTYAAREAPLWLMSGNYVDTYTNGLIDEFRFTKGVGRYGASNYDVPTEAFPSS